ncbi:MAG: 16S rRNA (cytosine(967)-C(5))-methyltransferase RsmB [Tissierellia bacterium]|nr:16S rRNA (cytosine(967)-C(5))-methyltransferase RsmB [Tissierellia bacterium]
MLKHPDFMINQREITLEIIKKSQKGEDLVELVENQKNLEPQEYGFIKSISFGTIRYIMRLDYIIKKLSKIKFSKIHIDILNIMRMSLYQLIYMGHIPESAVVNESVKLAKKYGNKGSVGFVNGSLRNFIRNREKFLEIDYKTDLDRLSIEHSYPIWIIEEIEKAYESENLEEILIKFNEPSKFVIRANSLKISREDLKSRLENLGFKVEFTKVSNDGLVIENPRGIFESTPYTEGLFYVQSESSQLVGQLAVENAKFENILDLCSSPGGKISHIYEVLKGKGNYIAADVNEEKIRIIDENFKRLGISDVRLVVNDGTILNENLKNDYDLIILDVPCSALGLMSKFPQIKYSKSSDDLMELSVIQQKILNNAKEYLKPGGKLIYSTCTFTLIENEDVLYKFLQENKNFSMEKEISKISPLDFDSDGFTIGVMIKDE